MEWLSGDNSEYDSKSYYRIPVSEICGLYRCIRKQTIDSVITKQRKRGLPMVSPSCLIRISDFRIHPVRTLLAQP